MELANEIVIGFASPGGNLERLCSEFRDIAKFLSLE
jgi:hypothetical protein